MLSDSEALLDFFLSFDFFSSWFPFLFQKSERQRGGFHAKQAMGGG